jgi:hypothetical protein
MSEYNYAGNSDLGEGVLFKIKDCLENDSILDTGQSRDHYAYWNARNNHEK